MNGRAPLVLRILGRLIGLAIIAAAIAAAVAVARTSSGNSRTDDAYVSANVIGSTNKCVRAAQDRWAQQLEEITPAARKTS
jgi:hypothetical protein